MMKRLKQIDELYNFKNIKEYITIYKNKNITKKYTIKSTLINKPNYQLYTENNGIITLAYGFIPNYINFFILNYNKLIKVVLDHSNLKIIENINKNKDINNTKYINDIIINIKQIHYNQLYYDDEETVDTIYDDDES